VNTVSFRPRMPPITFTNEDFKGVNPSQDDPMVISVDIDNFTIMKMLVDQRSSMDIRYWKTFKQMRIFEEKMKSYDDQVSASRVREQAPEAILSHTPTSSKVKRTRP